MARTEPTLGQKANDSFRTMLGIGGIVAVILGVLILVNPAKSGAALMQVLALVMAAYALIVGVIYAGSAIFSRTQSGWSRIGHVLLGVLFVIGGVVLMSNLAITATMTVVFLSVTVGVLWMFEGVMALIAAKGSGSRAWSILYGIVGILAGALLILSPFWGAFTLWILLGASLVAMGAVQILRAFTMKHAEPGNAG